MNPRHVISTWINCTRGVHGAHKATLSFNDIENFVVFSYKVDLYKNRVAVAIAKKILRTKRAGYWTLKFHSEKPVTLNICYKAETNELVVFPSVGNAGVKINKLVETATQEFAAVDV